MGSHPINLGLRFILELAALFALGYWGSQQGSGIVSVLLAVGLPVIAAAVWGIFAVPNDPSRSGKAPVVVSGLVRLLIEGALFLLAILALLNLGQSTLAVVFAIVVILHYAASYDRIAWLLRQ